jgi:hypothetical protein
LFESERENINSFYAILKSEEQLREILNMPQVTRRIYIVYFPPRSARRKLGLRPTYLSSKISRLFSHSRVDVSFNVDLTVEIGYSNENLKCLPGRLDDLPLQSLQGKIEAFPLIIGNLK